MADDIPAKKQRKLKERNATRVVYLLETYENWILHKDLYQSKRREFQKQSHFDILDFNAQITHSAFAKHLLQVHEQYCQLCWGDTSEEQTEPTSFVSLAQGSTVNPLPSQQVTHPSLGAAPTSGLLRVVQTASNVNPLPSQQVTRPSLGAAPTSGLLRVVQATSNVNTVQPQQVAHHSLGVTPTSSLLRVVQTPSTVKALPCQQVTRPSLGITPTSSLLRVIQPASSVKPLQSQQVTCQQVTSPSLGVTPTSSLLRVVQTAPTVKPLQSQQVARHSLGAGSGLLQADQTLRSGTRYKRILPLVKPSGIQTQNVSGHYYVVGLPSEAVSRKTPEKMSKEKGEPLSLLNGGIQMVKEVPKIKEETSTLQNNRVQLRDAEDMSKEEENPLLQIHPGQFNKTEELKKAPDKTLNHNVCRLQNDEGEQGNKIEDLEEEGSEKMIERMDEDGEDGWMEEGGSDIDDNEEDFSTNEGWLRQTGESSGEGSGKEAINHGGVESGHS